MKIIDRKDIEDWANRYESKGYFPYLISKLVWVTALPSVQVNIPSGSAAYLGGWDGEVKSESAESYVPQGMSLWEFGTGGDVRAKAEADYVKRSADALGHNPSECTFIFVTPRLWANKDIWVVEKRGEGIWGDVRVYDSIDLEQWLDQTTSVATWFASHVGRLPFDGTLTAEQFWAEWSVGPKGVLAPQTVTSGREVEIEKLLTFLSGEAGIRSIKASTKAEAMAFVIASAHQFTPAQRERFFSKTLLVDGEGAYRALHTNSRMPLNLMPKFDNTLPLYAAVSKGHHVIVPLGGDDTFSQDLIVLPAIRKEGQIEGLIKMGLSRTDAEIFSREAGRDITILRRLLKFHHSAAKWHRENDLREIVPVLLLGRWNVANVGDRLLLERLSGKSYDDYFNVLLKWRDMEESPLIQIGETWRLTSPLDLWSALSNVLTANDFDLLSECFLSVYREKNEVDDSNKTGFHSFFSKPKKYSQWSREGLTQSLILIGQYGNSLQIPNLANPQSWVDSLIEQLLYDVNGPFWTSLNSQLPLISEASPLSFIKAAYHSLELPDSPILAMFEEKESLFGESSHYTGLLWALEGLAWLPEYLYDATALLLKLSALDPGGRLVNRPNNSLAEIYKPWHFQTLTPYRERMEILQKAVFEEREKGWELLIRLLPQGRGTASPTHKLRWRLFDKNINLKYTYREIDDTHSFVIELLMAMYDNTEAKLHALVEASSTLPSMKDLETLLSFIEKVYQDVGQSSDQVRDKLRSILSRHRSYPDAAWSLPPEILDRYEKIYEHLEPKDIVLRYRWLFEEHHVQFPDGKYNKEKGDERFKIYGERVQKERLEAINQLLGAIGLQEVVALGNVVKYPQSIGQSLGQILNSEDDTITVLDNLKNPEINLRLIHSFAMEKFFTGGYEWAIKTYTKLVDRDFNNNQLAEFFSALPPSVELWHFIDNTNEEIKSHYWLSVDPYFYLLKPEERISGIHYLTHYKRFYSAVDTLAMFEEEIPIRIMVETLEKAATEESVEPRDFKEYEISSLFEKMDKSGEVDANILAKLEWMYLPILGSYGSSYKPKHLHDELISSPEFFIDVLKWVYLPKDEERRNEEQKDVPVETLKNYAEQGYRLLHDFKTIPGTREDGSIDEGILNGWIDRVRELATDADRVEIADMQIGTLLAQYSEKDKEHWPPDAISAIIERINTDSIKDNFSSATYNKRGSSVRGPYEGGTIERGHAAHFLKLAKYHKVKHPNLSKIFADMATHYIENAKREDEQAERARLEY